MKRALMSLGLCMATGLVLAAPSQQPYEVERWVGDHAYLFDFRGQAQPVLGPAKDNVLSAWQRLPFPFTCFGDRVDGYFISDNGYITFDESATTSVAANTALPSATAPRNSIFAFWTDIRLEAARGPWDNRVWTATLGRSPDRVHYIYWLSVVPAADTFARAGYNFGLALYEDGTFEAVFSSGRRATPVRATVGALSADGRQAVTAASDFDFPAVGYGGEDDVNFLFKKPSR